MSDTYNQNSCSQRPCQTRTSAQPKSNSSDDVNSELRGRPVLYAGVVWIGILRRFLIPRTCGSQLPSLAEPEPMPRLQEPPEAVSVNHVSASNPTTRSLVQKHPHTPALLANKPPEEELERRRLEMLKNSSNNLPHPPLAALVSQMQEASLAAAEHALQLTEDVSALVRNSKNTTAAIVSQVYEASLAAAEQALQLTEDISALMRNFRETTSESLAVLRAEEGTSYRCGVVAAAGLAGYLAGLPRGRTTRLVYTVTGAATAAVVCYPAEASVYNQQALEELRRWLGLGLAALEQWQDPEKPLEDEDLESAKSSKPNEQDQNQQLYFHLPSQNVNEDTHQEHNQQCVDSESSVLPEECSDEDANTPPGPARYYHPPAAAVPSGSVGPSCRSDRKLLSQCQPVDVTVGPHFPNSLPYSPEFPSQTRQSSSSGVPQSSQTTSYQEKIVQTAVPHSLHSNNRRDLPNPKLQDSNANILEGSQKIYSDKTTETKSNPLGIDKNSMGRGDDGQNQYPLNKKLSQYYVKKPNETTASTETGYEDLYSKRE